MAYSEAQCQKLKDDLDEVEAKIQSLALGEVEREISTATEKVVFQNASLSQLRNRRRELRAQFAAGSCAVVLGEELLPDPPPRRGLNPYFGSR